MLRSRHGILSAVRADAEAEAKAFRDWQRRAIEEQFTYQMAEARRAFSRDVAAARADLLAQTEHRLEDARARAQGKRHGALSGA